MKRHKRIWYISVSGCLIGFIVVLAVYANNTVLAFRDKTDWPVKNMYKWQMAHQLVLSKLWATRQSFS